MPGGEKARKIPRESFDETTFGPNYKGAIEVLKQAIDKDPNFWEAQLLIGEFYEYTLDYELAISHYEKAVEINPLHRLGKLLCSIS